MRILRIARVLLIAVATLGINNAAAFAAEPATPVDSTRTITDASPFGAFLFHNDDGWHFRTHGTPQGTTFTAHIVTNGTLHDVAAVRDEKDDHIRLDDAGHALDLSFATYSGVDGVDFRLDDAKYLHVRINANDELLPVENIFLGDDGRHPATNPFAIRLGDLHIPNDLEPGYTVRHDGDRLQLLTHDEAGSHEYTGNLTTTGTIEVVDLVQPEKDDSVAVSSDGHTVSFKFSTQEGVDGVVLRMTGAEKVQLTLDTDGQLTPVANIHLGSKNRSPKTNPFDIRA
ncbi:MAG TPA: hypothetical protein VKV73_12000 [Chloroflexota bacterium]|nr:hypothetical protein [Chloroflexota bacterium]